MTAVPRETDLFVVGGGPAGLAAAIAARDKGLRVVVAESAREGPIDKACGEGLMPDSLAALGSLGVDAGSSPGYPFAGIRFLGEGHSVEARFGPHCGLGIRRTALHQLLVQHALDRGVSILWGATVRALAHDAVELEGRRIRCRWIAGADGGNSTVRRWAGLDAGMSEKHRYGFRRHYALQPWDEFMEIHWGRACQVYVTPVAERELCVAVISRNPKLRLDEALSCFPDLSEKLASAPITSRERGAVSASRTLPRVRAGNVFLVGDASGSVDAITGEGLCLAFQQAAALADALARGEPRLYQDAHDRIRRRPALMADLMLLLDNRGWLRRRALSSLSLRPALFGHLLAAHAGAVPVTRLAGSMMALGWTMVFGV
ncbi:MAG: FAD-dependent monooxygenase [Bryobacterales bacterium]|nr:FAD-dependent monooxygenase [Bryobacterales bacterium]